MVERESRARRRVGPVRDLAGGSASRAAGATRSNGKKILFNTWAEAYPGESANLYTMHADGTHLVALTHYAGGTLQALAAGWSPDGTQIVFRRMKYSGTDTEVGGYFVLDLRTGHVRRLTPVRLRYDGAAAWGG